MEIYFVDRFIDIFDIFQNISISWINNPLAEYDYPPVTRDEVFKEIFEQAENFKKYSKEM